MRLLVLLIFVHSLASQDLPPSLLEDISLKVELKQADGSIKTQDLIEFINEGKVKMSTFGCQKKAIMVLGLTGVGKSTLVNYLNDIPLKCTRINRVWPTPM
jgi:putative ribosome biogenesis GTPase RsgA